MGPAIVLALLLAVGLPAAHAAPAQPPAHASSADTLASDTDSGDPEIRDLVNLVNHQRHASGCAPLAWDPALAREARRYSRDMAERGFFDHVSPAGANLLDRLRSAGIKFRGAAENLAAGQNTGEQVFANWMSDGSERGNLVNGQFTRVGVGRSGAIWTLMLVRPR
jgi:uncharacterized protein YkwD